MSEPTRKCIREIHPKSAAEMVAKELCNCIAQGILYPGEKLNEQALCQQLNVSRTPLREAFRMLQTQGLIEYNTNCGVVVRTVTEKYISDIMEVRCALDSLSAARAAKRINEKNAKTLLSIQEFGNQCLSSSSDDWYLDYDHKLHLTIAKLSENIELEKQFQNVWNSSLLMHCYNASTKERQIQSIREHGWIIDAIIAGDAEQATAFMKMHYTAGCASTIKAYLQATKGILGMQAVDK